MTRTRVYSLLGIVLLLAAWAILRGIPLYKDARHYQRELASLPAELAPQTPSTDALRREVRALQSERETLGPRAETQIAGLEDTLEGLARGVGLSIDEARTELRPRRPLARSHGQRRLQPTGRSRAPAEREAFLKLKASGDFRQIQAFVTELTRWDEPSRVETLEISLETNPKLPGPLRLELGVVP